MATRSARRGRPPSTAGDPPPRHEPPAAEAEIATATATEFEDVRERAARIGVTVDKVLQEYARIAFADLRHILSWDETGLRVKEHLSRRDAAPIAEIGTAASGNGPVRIKLYDKKAALDAIARYLGMFATTQRRQEDDEWAAEVEEAREELARRLARLAAESSEDAAARVDEPARAGDDPA